MKRVKSDLELVREVLLHSRENFLNPLSAERLLLLLGAKRQAEAVNSASVEQFKIELDKVIDTLI